MDKELSEQIRYYDESIELRNLILRLLDNDDFKKFKKRYAEDYALSQLNNAHNYNQQGRERFAINFAGRSMFINFIQEAIEEGNESEISKEVLMETIEVTENGEEHY